MPRRFVFNLRGEIRVPQPYPFLLRIQTHRKTDFAFRVGRSVVRLKSSDADYSYPAENSAPQGKREPLESTAIHDRINGDSRPAWRAYMLQFEPHFFESKPTVSSNIIPQFKPKVKYILLSLNSRQHTHHVSDPNLRQACQKTGR